MSRYNPFSMLIQERSSHFVLALIAIIVIHYFPAIAKPYELFEEFFHESAHGLSALFSGGNFSKITMSFNKGISTNYSGGIVWLSLFAGYLGNIIFGILIYYIAAPGHKNQSNMISILLALFAISVTSIIGSNKTIVIGSLLGVAIFLIIPLRKFTLARIIYKSVGLYLVVSVFFVPVNSIINYLDSDASRLGDVSLIPAPLWIIAWCVLAVSALRYLWVNHCLQGW